MASLYQNLREPVSSILNPLYSPKIWRLLISEALVLVMGRPLDLGLSTYAISTSRAGASGLPRTTFPRKFILESQSQPPPSTVQQRLRVRLAAGTDHLLHQEPRISLRNQWRLRQWSSRYSCGIPRIFKVRRGIDSNSKLSSSEILLVDN